MKVSDINKEVVAIVKSIKVLDKISWPYKVEEKFLESLKKGQRVNLNFKYPKMNYREEVDLLKKYLPFLSTDNPLEIFTRNTVQSYLNALEMIHSVGTSRFQELSEKEYGRPSHLLFGSQYSHLDTAKKFLDSYHQFEHPYLKEEELIYTAKDLKKFLQKDSRIVFGDEAPKFQITSKITAKAAAAKSKVRIRKNAEFTKYDFSQLLVHEVMTHSLTGINGNQQTELLLLSQGAPRTTKTQEGLATFSEVITGSLDLARLKRISLRVIAIDMALSGADLYDLFKYFKENGQDDKESYLSASRILRGGHAKGGIVFTKDGVYLEGLIRVHSFFRWAFKTQNLDLVHLLFCGRLDINDIFLLKDEYKRGVIKAPKFLPDWYQHIDLLAGKMAFSLILNGIDLNLVEEHFEKKF